MQMPRAIVGRNWRDESGRLLHFRRRWLTSGWCARIRARDFKWYSLRGLGHALRMSRMPALWQEEKLVVELGYPGMGPTLELSVQWDEDLQPVRLNPRVCTGLYNDWDEDFGVPWVFPLSPYKLVAE